ncbi:recombinase family protein [Brevundimonas vesicularis]
MTMLGAAEVGKFDALIIQNCDRLSRNRCDVVSVMAQLAASGIEILTVDNGLVSGLGITRFAGRVEFAQAKAPQKMASGASASPKSGG